MAFLDIFKKKQPAQDVQATAKPEDLLRDAITKLEALNGIGSYSGTFNRVFWRPFDGEKNLGNLGVINKYSLDFDGLRLRSWQLFLTSEVVQIGIKRYAMWLIGAGLKLRAEPEVTVLEKYGIKIDSQEFSKNIEAFFKLYANSQECDYSSMQNLHQIMWDATVNALVGGDVLFILNISDEGLPNIRLIDGANVHTPLMGMVTNFGLNVVNPDTGYRIRNGIEIDAKGKHVAFWVRRGANYNNTILTINDFERVEATDKETGLVRAWMHYGMRYRLDDIRGIPLITACMEAVNALDRYKTAMILGAEERAKVALVVQHEQGAIGSNPFEGNMMKAFGGTFSDIPADSLGNQAANQVAATTGNQAINLTPGAKLVALEGKQEIHFKEFYDENLTILFAALDIPKEIALMLFGSNYSASRASIKDWEHTLIVRRKKDVAPSLDHVYNATLFCMTAQSTVQAPGYLQAVMKQHKPLQKNLWIRLAYQNTKWIGDNPPNIDELKEVTAARLKMGAGSAHLPLDGPDTIINDIGIHSDLRHSMEEYASALEFAAKLGIEEVETNKEKIKDFNEGEQGNKGEKPEPKTPTKKSNKDKTK